MSIKPLDMQVLIPKTEEVAQRRTLENHKNPQEQAAASHMMNKKNMKNNQTVTQTNQNEKFNDTFDAKEKGKQSYQGNSNKKKKNLQKDTGIKDKHSTIDIKI
ncbi:hypothetical protein EDC19_0323 [Natranaerovirga hydrolytica]|uniref:Uncharacterized protein n=1 Tax=Natranaerovirga hydrolytica TaxID=680378 RepID=A0A4V2Q1K0_9FIRM|nr:hypothetical protein [Natranaerovirga hydrolytica]TCK97921.1 hypothetical protein EDC19_0323 [Natranaerovirga hydrolytica]